MVTLRSPRSQVLALFQQEGRRVLGVQAVHPLLGYYRPLPYRLMERLVLRPDVVEVLMLSLIQEAQKEVV